MITASPGVRTMAVTAAGSSWSRPGGSRTGARRPAAGPELEAARAGVPAAAAGRVRGEVRPAPEDAGRGAGDGRGGGAGRRGGSGAAPGPGSEARPARG